MSSQQPDKVLIVFGDHCPAFLLGGKLPHIAGSKTRDSKFWQLVQRQPVFSSSLSFAPRAQHQSSTLKCSWARHWFSSPQQCDVVESSCLAPLGSLAEHSVFHLDISSPGWNCTFNLAAGGSCCPCRRPAHGPSAQLCTAVLSPTCDMLSQGSRTAASLCHLCRPEVQGHLWGSFKEVICSALSICTAVTLTRRVRLTFLFPFLSLICRVRQQTLRLVHIKYSLGEHWTWHVTASLPARKSPFLPGTCSKALAPSSVLAKTMCL